MCWAALGVAVVSTAFMGIMGFMGSMIVTIDGPAGAGKSSVARQLAERLGFRFLDTGAMYRSVALAALRQGIDLTDETAVDRVAAEMRLELDPSDWLDSRIWLDGLDVSSAIRTQEVTAATRYAADNPQVRQRLVEWQRRLVAGHDVVTEGRDQGTVAFPHAQCKIFLTASAAERAQRRHKQLASQGESADYQALLVAQSERDQRDYNRPVGALRKAEDAIEVCTDGLELPEVVDWLEQIVQARRN